MGASSWETDFEEASATAKASNKYMLLDFSGSDWCGWCVKLDNEVFSKKAFKDYAKENLVCVLVDFPRRKQLKKALKEQNAKLQQKYGVRGFPTVIVLSPTGDLVGKTGYKAGGPDAYVSHLKGMIDPHREKNKIAAPTSAKKPRLGAGGSAFARPSRPSGLPRDETREVRSWTSTTGAKVEAAIVEEKGTYVVFKSAEGKTFQIARNRLSKDDQSYIEELKKAMVDTPPQ